MTVEEVVVAARVLMQEGMTARVVTSTREVEGVIVRVFRGGAMLPGWLTVRTSPESTQSVDLIAVTHIEAA